MMNLLALTLLISSLAAAGVLSPSPQPTPQSPNSHRVIVVEYERQIPSFPSSPPSPPASDDDSMNKVLEADSAVSRTPKEKICDAYGVCKDKVSPFFTTTKHKASQLEESATEAVKTAADTAKEKVIDAGEKVEENVSSLAMKTVDRAAEASVELRRNLTEILRRARELSHDTAVLVAAGAGRAVWPLVEAGHLLGFATAFGTCVWVTFGSSHVLTSALTRQQFGVVQSRLYPVYFRAVAFSVGAAAAAFFFGRWRQSAVEQVQGYNLMAVLGIVLVNLLFLEPKATQAMFERMKLEKEEGRSSDMADGGEEPVARGPMVTPFDLGLDAAAEKAAAKSRMEMVSKRLKRFNTYSSFLNVLAVMGLSWHLVYLAKRLGLSC